MVGNQGDIHVIFDYQNVIYIDPNKVINGNQEVLERGVIAEDFVMYANLETKLIPRTKLLVNGPTNNEISTITLGSINFLNPNNEEYLNSNYYNEFTGDKTLEKKGANQKQTFEVNQDGETFTTDSAINLKNNALFGIKKISVKTNSSFIPTVSIEMEDVQGRALFSLGDQSPYAAFFNLPYPPFYLTLKGYYGKAVRYELSLLKFNSRFNGLTGDYSISLEFIGFKYNVLSEINMGHLLATPHMYTKKYEITSATNQSVSATKDSVFEINTELGYQKVVEVYKDYKSKGLISQDFPELTLSQLIYKLEFFEQNILNSLNKISVEILTDGKTYQKNLNEYYNKIRSNQTSWFNKYINQKPVIYNDNDNTFAYTFKKEVIDNAVTTNSVEEAISKLKAIIDQYNLALKNNPSFGDKGVNYIKNNITYDFITKTADNIDWVKTYSSRIGGVSLTTDTSVLQNQMKDVKVSYVKNNVTIDVPLFDFSKFISEINRIETFFSKEISKKERELSETLANRIAEKETGIGFIPNIKNVIAIIMASTEAFLRLLDNVHENAWNVRQNKDRLEAIGAGDLIDDNTNQDPIVFPWPLVSIKNENAKANKYELIYPGDNQVITKTKAYLLENWPEVEFVEEYLKGFNKRLDRPINSNLVDSNDDILSKFGFNTFEYPFNELPYNNALNSQFFYELWDRHFGISFNSGYSLLYKFSNGSKQVVVDFISQNETKNIEASLSSNSILFFSKLKNILNANPLLNGSNYEDQLLAISNNGASSSYQKYKDGFYNTIYLNNILNNASQLYKIETFRLVTNNFINTLKTDNFKKIINDTQPSNDINFLYPFNNPTWSAANLTTFKPNKYDTSGTLFFNADRNIITNFKEIGDIINNKPFKFFPNDNTNKLTFGNIYQNQFGRAINTTLLNTPIFINAIQQGVDNWRNVNSEEAKKPFITAAYLFLSSLPLSNLTDFFINNKNQKNGFVFASFIKYSAIHKLPFAWILKYGSIWYRYKKYINEQQDILDDVWVNFDYNEFFNNTEYTFNGTTIKLIDGKNINLGFYPKLTNDFNVFLNGYDLFKVYDNKELTDTINRGFNVLNTGKYILDGYTVNNWSSLVPVNIYDMASYPDYCPDQKQDIKSLFYILPSYNAITTQTTGIINKNIPVLIDEIHNGAIKIILSDDSDSFSFDSLVKPKYNEYINIKNDTNSFSLTGAYSSIEDIFAIFDSETLDLFENEFIKFSRSIYDFDTTNNKDEINLLGLDYQDPNTKYLNFQLMFREMMEVPSNRSNKTEIDYFKEVQSFQKTNIQSVLNGFLSYDILFKYGNPTKYNKYYYNSFIEHIGGIPDITNTLKFNPYIQNTLPPQIALISVNQNTFNTLQKEVGFSTITNLAYADSGSYITDFFINNNIEFSVENVTNLSHIIKIYANERLKNPALTKQNFLQILQNEQNVINGLVEDSLTGTLFNVKSITNNKTITEVNTINTVLDSKVSKYDLYETFKAINDKWVSGNDYTTTTLFEDVLFLDRGGRNIGELFFVDIFDLKKILNGRKVNLETSVFNFIGGILTKNHFNIFPMPSYVNFYGALSPGDNIDDVIKSSTEVANDTWGNFTTVDYRKSGPKLVCVYAGKGSSVLNNSGSSNIRYGNDAIDWDNNIPFLEDQRGKTDWALSNKCVSFLVDAGIRNQAIFHNIVVSQDGGVATAESLQTIENIRSNVSGRNVSTQNTSLFNLYKNLSYTAQISCMGNAILQPTMYFNLQHIPLFNGPYFITEVNHEITPGTFETTFSGVRQSIYALPSIDTYLASINENLLTQITAKFERDKLKKETELNAPTNNSTPTGSNNCGDYLFTDYASFSAETSLSVSAYTELNFYNAITGKTTDSKVIEFVYLYSYLASNIANNFKAYENNFGNVWLTYGRGDFAIDKYYCGQDNIEKTITRPFALFEKLDDYLDYIIGNYQSQEPFIKNIGYLNTYIAYWLYPGLVDPESEVRFANYVNILKRNGKFNDLESKLVNAFKSLKGLSPAQLSDSSKTDLNNTNNALNPDNKINKDCTFTYRNPSVKLPTATTINFPYSFEVLFNSKNKNELTFMENVNKEVEKVLLNIYSIGFNPEIIKYDVTTASGTTFEFKISINVNSGNTSYTGFKILGSETKLDPLIIENVIKTNQNYSTQDLIKPIAKYENPTINLYYIYANYTKINLYPHI